ncbi:DUF523 domain-containing protein [bacterium]|nr:DUF523 domain-containing protein [bacterium]
MEKSVLISACLVGESCRYDGQGKLSNDLLELLQGTKLFAVCPEVEGGLPIPRPPAEIKGEKVIRANAEDVTPQFKAGAKAGLELALKEQVSMAILKSRSPACGCGQIYDGSFSGVLIKGDGILTRELKAMGIECISDEEFLNSSR